MSLCKVLVVKLEVSLKIAKQSFKIVLFICLHKIFLETVGARETARLASVAAVSKTVTASVTPTAV